MARARRKTSHKPQYVESTTDTHSLSVARYTQEASESPGRVDALLQITLDIRSIQQSGSPAWMHQVRIGAALMTARQLLDNETFTQWVEHELGLPIRLALIYITCAKRLQEASRI